MGKQGGRNPKCMLCWLQVGAVARPRGGTSGATEDCRAGAQRIRPLWHGELGELSEFLMVSILAHVWTQSVVQGLDRQVQTCEGCGWWLLFLRGLCALSPVNCKS